MISKCEFSSDVLETVREKPGKIGGGISSVALLMCGAVSGATAKTIIAPADRVKIMFQTSPGMKFSYSKALSLASSIWNSTGFWSLWRGNAATLVRIFPYSGINYLMFARIHDSMHESGCLSSEVLTRFMAGAGAGLCASATTYPLELLRARMAVDTTTVRKSYFATFSLVYQEKGVRELYRGALPTLLGVVPYAGISFMTYETLKDAYDVTSLSGRLSAGAIAGISAQVATYPLDVVRRRMQVHSSEYRSMSAAIRKIYTTEGVRNGLYRGMSMNFVKGPISVAVSLSMNDFLKTLVS